MSCFKHLFNKSKVFQYKTILHSNYFYLRLFQNNFHLNNVNKICSRSMHKSDDVISSSLLKECLQLQNKMTNYSIIDVSNSTDTYNVFRINISRKSST